MSSGLGVALLLMFALAQLRAADVEPRARRRTGNVALRLAGIALIIVSIMFGRLGKGK